MTSEQLEQWRHHASRTPSEMTNALFAHIDEQAEKISHNKERLTKNELKMIAECLKEYSDLSRNQGCNDHWLPDTDENWKLIREVQRWNSSNPEEWDTREEITSDSGLFIIDSALPHYFADKIRKCLAAGENDDS